ncbi:hypothetical protein [Psychroserpens sp.]|jgi:hypothetical protein|uniref:hypothetical protein n=1 Tax=Psychroserpens sp. TaxID=2020870 RepID=UPI0039E6176C
MQIPSRNTLTLLFSGLIFASFFIAGVLGFLDYLIVKAILFSAFTLLAIYLISIVLKNTETE